MLTYHLLPDKYAQAVAYQDLLAILHFAGVAAELLILWALHRWGYAARLGMWAERISRRLFVQALLVVPAFLAAPLVALLPLNAWRHYLAVRVGISVQSWPAWFSDWLMSAAILAATATLLTWGLFALVRRSPGRWWLYAWLGAIPLAAGAVFLYPVVIDPLFNRFEPLPPKVAAAIEQVAERAGYRVPPSRMYEMKAGDKLRAVNAYMTGFGATRRIVIWDTTITALTLPQLQSVFAHELGHYALHHIPIGAGLSLLLILAGLFAARRLVPNPGEWRTLARWFLFLVAASFLTEPLVNTYSRWQEHQADIFELDTMRGLVPDAGRVSAEVDQIMGEINLDHPDPNGFIRFWLYDHPTTAERMVFAQRYAAPGTSSKR